MKTTGSSRTVRNFCLGILFLFGFVGVFAPFLANEDSILVIDYNNGIHWFPKTPPDSVQFEIKPLIPYSPQNIDTKSMGAIGPFERQGSNGHWLGTDPIGRDILSAIIWGAQTSLIIGLFSTFIAGLIGVLIGGFAGYFGNSAFVISPLRSYLTIGIIIFFIFYYVHILKVNWIQDTQLSNFIFISVLQLFILCAILYFFNLLLARLEKKRSWKVSSFPIDDYLSRAMEITSTLPILFIIIILSAILRPSIWNVVLIIGFTGWTGIARYTRSEFLSIKKMNFVLSAKSLGVPNRKILFRHILPNTYTTISTALSFAFAGAILAETTLSFLGIGLPPEKVSWGSILSMARQYPQAWWLILFPSLSIFSVIFSLQYLARYYNRNQE